MGCGNLCILKHPRKYCDDCYKNDITLYCDGCKKEFTLTVEQHKDRRTSYNRIIKNRAWTFCLLCTPKYKNIVNEIGNTYGCLKVTDFAGVKKKGTAHWICKCECGDERSYIGTELRRLGNFRACTHGDNQYNTMRRYHGHEIPV
jgi:hypothetical protein